MSNADVAHLVERHLAKVEVASSSLVIRSKSLNKLLFRDFVFYRVVEIFVDKQSRGRTNLLLL